jgi:MFS family permease
MVYVVVFLASACSQFFNPSRLALIGDLVEEPDRPKASGLIQGSSATALVVGPLLSAPLLVAFGVQWALAINALSFVASFLSIAAVRAPKAARSVAPGEHGNVVQEFLAGARFAFGHRVISTLIIAMCLLSLGHGGIHALYVFFTRDNLHADVAAVGVVGAVFGAGGIAGAFLWGATARRIGLARLFCAALLSYGVILLLTARLTSLAPGLVFFFAIGIVEAAIEVAVGPLVLNAAPREMVGRVMAILSPAVRATELVAVALSGYLASTLLVGFQGTVLGFHVGPIDTIFTISAVLMALGGIFAATRLRGLPQEQPETASAPPSEAALQAASTGTDQ